ncbi:hypothetical protein ACJ41O_012156 [Fusarium nematophilum]
MGSPQLPRTVEFKTIDGITLEAWLYEFNCVKEMSLEETTEAFHSAGYNVLLYDSRSIGGSGGSPRNHIDPLQMAQDISDAVTYARTIPSVDPQRVLLWGMSLGGTVIGVAAAVDRRVAGILMVCPIFSMIRADKRATAFARLMKDRQSQLRGNEPFMIQPFNSKGENPIGYAGSGGPGGKEAHFLMSTAAERGHPNFRDRITFQSYHKMALFRPKELLEEMLEGVPTMMMIPELDEMSPPAEQKAVFDNLKTPKKLYWAKGKGHMSILSGEDSHKIRTAMVEFFDMALEQKGT